MRELLEKIDKEKFANSVLAELSKLPFGSLPKSELELVFFNSIIESYGGYDNINIYSQLIQSSLKMSHAKFKNKLLQAQIRFDNKKLDAKEILKDIFLKVEISNFIFDGNYLSLYINNSLKVEYLKTFIHSQDILNDASLNNNLLKIHFKGILQILPKIFETEKLKDIQKEIIKRFKINNKVSDDFIGALNFDSIFKIEFSLDPLKSVKELVEIIRNLSN